MAKTKQVKLALWIGGIFLICATSGACYECNEAIATHHHVEIVNNTDQSLEGFRLAFDNVKFWKDASPIPAHGRYVFDFVQNQETGYVFSVDDRGTRLELGRCGYAEPGLNAYVVTVSSLTKDGFHCDDVTPDNKRVPF